MSGLQVVDIVKLQDKWDKLDKNIEKDGKEVYVGKVYGNSCFAAECPERQ